MVNFINPDKRSLGFGGLVMAAQLLYHNLWNRGGSILKTEQAATQVLNALKPQAASTALVLSKVLPSAKTVEQCAAGVTTAGVLGLGAPTSTVPLLAAPVVAASAGSAAAAGVAGEGIFTGAYTAASTAAKFAWSHLSWRTLGAGAGALGLAYLAYKYWKGNGVNITNTNTNTNTVHINLVGLDPKTTVVKTDDGKGTVHCSLLQTF